MVDPRESGVVDLSSRLESVGMPQSSHEDFVETPGVQGSSEEDGSSGLSQEVQSASGSVGVDTQIGGSAGASGSFGVVALTGGSAGASGSF